MCLYQDVKNALIHTLLFDMLMISVRDHIWTYCTGLDIHTFTELDNACYFIKENVESVLNSYQVLRLRWWLIQVKRQMKKIWYVL